MSSPYTDDEVLGAAYASGHSWSRPLATVDVMDPAELTAGVARGLRSLGLRGLLDESGTLTAQNASLVEAIAGRPHLVATWVDADYVPLLGHDRFELIKTPSDGWIAATVSPGGVHTYAETDLSAALDFLGVVARSGVGIAEAPTFCLVAIDQRGRSTAALAVGPAGVSRLQPRQENDQPHVDELGTTSVEWERELQALLDHAVT